MSKFIEYIRPPVREPGPKGAWDFMSYSNGWRHARLIVTKKSIPFISGDVEGDVYDAEKVDKSRLSPIYEKFRVTSLNRYLPVGNLRDNIDDNKIKALLNAFLNQTPDYNLVTNNCEDLAKALSKKIIDGPFPTQEKMRGAVYPVSHGSMAEIFVKIVVEDGFDDAVIYDPNASLTKGPGPKSIDDMIEEEK